MAYFDFGEKDLYAGVTEDFPFTVTPYQNDNETPAVLAADDVLHLALSTRDGDEPVGEVLHIQSNQSTAGHSRVYVTDLGDDSPHEPAVGYVRFGQADTAAIVAAWDEDKLSERLMCELWFVDASESNPVAAKKIFLRGVIHLHRSAAAA